MSSIVQRGQRYSASVRRKGQKPLYQTFRTRSEAERWARRVEASMDAGQHVDLSEADKTLLSEALRRYVAEITPLKKGACQERSRINSWPRDPLSKRSLTSIRSVELAQRRDQKLAEGKAPQTIHIHLCLISHLYKAAASEWGMEGLRNPARHVRHPKARPGRERRLEGDEQERLFAACEDVYLQALVVLAIETGMRLGEMLSLDRAASEATLPHLPETKNGRARSVPLSSRARAAIASVPPSIDRKLFPYTANRVGNLWRKTCAAAGVEGLRFHDLRHEATSRLFERGLDMMEVASITGHRTLSMLQRYTRLKAARLAEKLG